MTRKTPKICHISTVDISSGILLLNQMLYFKARGIETHAMAARVRYADKVQDAGIPFHDVPMTRVISPMKDLVALREMVKILRRERFDLIHLHTPKGVLLGTLAGALAGTPFTFRTIHGFYFNANIPPMTRLFFVNMERFVARFHHTVFSQNSEDIKTADAKGIRSARDIRFLGNGIDLTRFTPDAVDRDDVAALRREYGIEQGDIVLGFVGRMVIQKGLRELFRAFVSLAPRWPRLKLLLVGDIDREKTDAVLAEDHVPAPLLPRVIRAGWQTEVHRFYPLMDAFVLPSWREGFPRTPMEASALGVPVVATDIRGCREAVANGDNGLLVPCKDERALAAALDRLMADPDLRKSLGEGGQRKARREFNEVDKFEMIYQTYARLFDL